MRAGKIFGLGAAFVTAILTVLLAGCGGSGSPPVAQGSTISSDALWTDLFTATPPDVVDVRSADAYALSHLPDSRNVPNGTGLATTTTTAASTAQATPMVIVADSEATEDQIVASLAAAGDSAEALAGGLAGWKHGLDLSAQELEAWINQSRNIELVDVRTTTEWTTAHIPGTVNHPLADLDTWCTTLDKQAEIVCICATGVRSAKARDELAQKGFTHVDNLLGGTDGWPYDNLQGTGCG